VSFSSSFFSSSAPIATDALPGELSRRRRPFSLYVIKAAPRGRKRLSCQTEEDGTSLDGRALHAARISPHTRNSEKGGAFSRVFFRLIAPRKLSLHQQLFFVCLGKKKGGGYKRKQAFPRVLVAVGGDLICRPQERLMESWQAWQVTPARSFGEREFSPFGQKESSSLGVVP